MFSFWENIILNVTNITLKICFEIKKHQLFDHISLRIESTADFDFTR